MKDIASVIQQTPIIASRNFRRRSHRSNLPSQTHVHHRSAARHTAPAHRCHATFAGVTILSGIVISPHNGLLNSKCTMRPLVTLILNHRSPLLQSPPAHFLATWPLSQGLNKRQQRNPPGSANAPSLFPWTSGPRTVTFATR